MAEKQNDLTRTILRALFIVSLIGISLWILLPFLPAIIWASTIVAATWPLMIKIQSWLWGRRWAAVTVMTLILLCLLVVPLSAAIGVIVSNTDTIIGWAKSLAHYEINTAPEWVRRLPFVGVPAAEVWNKLAASGYQGIAARVWPYAGSVIKWFVSQVGSLSALFVDNRRSLVDADHGTSDADRDGVRQCPIGVASQPQQAVEPGVWPCGADAIEKGATLCGALQRQFSRAPEGLAPSQRVGKPLFVAIALGPPCRAKKNGVASAGAVAQDAFEPGPQARRIGDQTDVHRVLDAVRVTVGADREGGRQPGQQLDEPVFSLRGHGPGHIGDGGHERRRCTLPALAQTAPGGG